MSQLTSPSNDLLAAASRGRERAYAPYSDFRMGAAVQTAAGEIIAGSLVENVSLGLAMCAERVALFTTVTTGHRPVELVLTSKRTAGGLTWPCGACLQVALELGGADLVVHAVDLDGVIETQRLGDLLPRGPKTKNSGLPG
ncbi:MAG: cytidine deaminase [Ilumatobacteraceae bacterium]